MYVIQRDQDGQFVSRPGSRNSYTDSLQAARKFGSRTEAENDCCGNEHVVAVKDLPGTACG